MSTTASAHVWTIDGQPVPHEVYHRDNTAVSNSRKELFRQSRKLFADLYVYETKPVPAPTEALRVGVYGHVATWEPDIWRRDYWLAPTMGPDGTKLDRRKKTHKEAWDEYQANATEQGKIIVDADEWEAANNIREALMANPCTRQIIEAAGECEHSIRWYDDETGLFCKCRRDKVLEHYNGGPTVIVDLKTTSNIHPDDWFRDAATFGYHRNAAWYQWGHHCLTGEVPLYAFMVVDKKTHECALYYLEDEDLDIGAQQNAKTLREMKACFDSGDWRADHETQFTSRPLPEWARKQARQELMQ